MEHKIQREIIVKLIHNPRAEYNELRSKTLESSKFAYHLKKLEEEGVVEKYQDGYGLTSKGKTLSASLEGDTGEKTKFPIVAAAVIARKERLILSQQRLKEPFYGLWNMPSGKIEFGINPEETAYKEFKEETGLEAKELKLRLIEHIKTYEEDELVHHHIIYIYETWNPEGELIEQTKKEKNEWLTVEELKQSQRLIGDFIFEKLLDSENLFIADFDRKIDNMQVEYKTRQIKEYKLV